MVLFDGQVAFDRSFASYAELAAQFQDAVIDVGPYEPDRVGYAQAIDVSLELTPADGSSTFAGQIVLATAPVPEPAGVSALAAAVGLGTRRRRGRLPA